MSAIDNYANAINEDEENNYEEEDSPQPVDDAAPKKSSNLPYIAAAAALSLVVGGFVLKNLSGPSRQEVPTTPLAQEMGVATPATYGADTLQPTAPLVPFEPEAVSGQPIYQEQAASLVFDQDPFASAPTLSDPPVAGEGALAEPSPTMPDTSATNAAPMPVPAGALAFDTPAVFSAPSSPLPAETAKEIEQLRQDMAQINQRLDALVEQLSKKIDALELAQAKLATAQAAKAAEKTRTAKPKAKPVAKSTVKDEAAPALHVYAMRSDKAWLKSAENGDSVTVEVGSHITGLGTVKIIDIASQSVVLENGRRISVQ